MSIHVQVSPPLRKYIRSYDPDSGLVLADRDRYTVAQVIAELNIPPQEVVSIMVNSYPATPNTVLQAGDCLSLAKIIGGG
jgi:sulfur carrier protein ThiS